MRRNPKAQRGEGKIGCIVSLVVLVILGGIAAKIVPYWWAVDQLISSADELASRAGVLNDATLAAQLKTKAGELELNEALKPGAIGISKLGDSSGTCTITLKFKRDIDFYGVTSYTWVTDKRIAKPYARY